MKAKNLFITILIALLASSFYIWRSVQKKVTKTALPETIIVGTNAEYPPFTFIKNNQIVGFDIDVVKEAFRRINKKTEIKDMSFKALIPSIQLGQIQVIAAGMTATPQRAKHILFTKPYVIGDKLLIVNLAKNPPIKKISELTGKKVIVDEGYTADLYLSKIKGPILQRFASPAQSFLALQSGRAQAYVIAESSARLFFEKHGEQNYNHIPIEGTEETYSLAISKKHPQILDKIQEALNSMEKDGTLQELKIKWKIKSITHH